MINKELALQGVVTVKNLIKKDDSLDLYYLLLERICDFASELNCDIKDYLTSVSRWGNNSHLTMLANNLIDANIKSVVETKLDKEIELVKANIISKTAYSPHPIPCHQDISYQTNECYDFSVWLALTDIELDSGPLMCLPKSHLDTIYPAPDFWAPDFYDHYAQSSDWMCDAKSFPMKAGDAVLFDAATMHGSAWNKNREDRYALVTRWRFKNSTKQISIPKPMKAKFGMWNCYEKTKHYLEKLLECNAIEPGENFTDIIKQTSELLLNLNGANDKAQARKALEHVKILHLASLKHDGGDAQGRIYATLWNQLLIHIDKSVKKTPHIQMEGAL